jgi:hypothetical protein
MKLQKQFSMSFLGKVLEVTNEIWYCSSLLNSPNQPKTNFQ